MKIILTTISLLLAITPSFGQEDKAKILAYFNKVEYFSDSLVIKSAYTENCGIADGIGIDFNEKGDPAEIGLYKNGERYGWWMLSNGGSINYSCTPPQHAIYPCGQIIAFGKKYFKIIYNRVLTDPTLNAENIWQVVK